MREFGNAAANNVSLGGRILGTRGAVASEHYLSAQAGMDMLMAGGNAFDAAAAATLVENVVNGHMFTLGGECPMLALPASDGTVHSINGNTRAPMGATLDAFAARGLSLIPPRGVLASGVPACLDSLLTMLEHWGSLPLADIVAPARELADRGFPVHDGLFHMPLYGLAENADRFRREWPATAALYLDGSGAPRAVGDTVRNPDMAAFLAGLADTGRGKDHAGSMRAARRFFYEGEPSELIARFSRERDGLLTREDMAAFFTRVEEPASINALGATIHKCGPWSQGPVFLQLVRLMEGFDLVSMGHNSAEYLHLWLEAAKLAYADREQYYGDPDHIDVPLDRLLSPEYAALRRTLLDPGKASLELAPGDPRRMQPLLPEDEVVCKGPWGPGTVHVAVADSMGNLAALTPSGGWIMGNETIPGLGFPLGTRVQTFHLRQGHPNAPAPGKRPRTTLSPSMAVFDEPGRAMAFGTMGGDQQDQWTSQFLLNILVFGMGVQEAVEAPKVTSNHFPGTFYPHGDEPGLVKLEGRIPEGVRHELASLGHRIDVEGDWSAGYICAAMRHANGLLEAAADFRGNTCRVFPATALAR